MRLPLPPSNLARQHGAVAVYVGIFMVALVAALTLTIDIGRLYTAQRDLQRVANTAALDASQISGGCYGNQGGLLIDDPLQLAINEVGASVARNQLTVPDRRSPISVSQVQIGRLTTEEQGGFRRFVPVGAAAGFNARTAVQVELSRPPPQRLLPLSAGSLMTATAAADSRPQAAIRVGSGVAAVNGGLLNALLGGLLGGSVNLTVLQFEGLLNTTVRLGDLALAAGAGTVDDYLTAETSLGDAFDDILDALGNGTDGGVRTALTQLANAASASREVTPGNVLLTPLGLSDDAENALVNVGDLVMALAQSANGETFINLPLNGLVNIPGVASITGRVGVIDPPKLAVIRAGDQDTFVSTAQTQVDLTLNLLNTNLNILGLLQAQTALRLPLSLRVGSARASLEEIQCARRGQPQHSVAVNSRTSVLDLALGSFTSAPDAAVPTIAPAVLGEVTAQVTILFITLRIPVARITGGALASLDNDEETSLFDGPYPSEILSQSSDLGPALTNLSQDLVSNLDLDVELIGIGLPVGNILTPVLNLLSPVLGAVGGLLEPVLALLGVSVGNADVQVVSLSPVNDNLRVTPDPDQQLSLQAFLFNH